MTARQGDDGLGIVIGRNPTPEPWSEGDNIPWHEPRFSARMLREHLSQEHDAASRRSAKIDAHVAWIHRLLDGRPSRILDLGCGPGLYANRLARLGHACVGVDWSPASIAYAVHTAEEEDLDCTYVEQDIRRAEYGDGYDLVMLLYGEFNVFRPLDAQLILGKAWAALATGGILLLEPHTYGGVEAQASAKPHWYTSEGGLFSDRPHLCLTEHHWDDAQRVRTDRYYVLDGETCAVRRYAASYQAYTDAEYRALLARCGFVGVQIHPSLTGAADEWQEWLLALVARKGTAQGHSAGPGRDAR
jgi:SAM-dependent methyltransferase